MIGDITLPIVSFVVVEPLNNIASQLWHEKTGFYLAGTCTGNYKDKDLK
ncbi:MAG: hypothetical protein ACFFAS_10295 [Promethearchaeota archaeon]